MGGGESWRREINIETKEAVGRREIKKRERERECAPVFLWGGSGEETKAKKGEMGGVTG